MSLRREIERAAVRGLVYQVTRRVPWWVALPVLLVLYIVAGSK